MLRRDDADLLGEIEAAAHLGITVELLRYFVRTCPKPGQNRTLASHVIEEQDFFTVGDLTSFLLYLAEPWPLPPRGRRPHIPKPIRDFVAQEAHYTCAVCGMVERCEVAHIEAVADTLNNSPDNLIYLCPNHHTQYDNGVVRPASNLTLEVVRAIKTVKKDALRRVLRHEQNAFVVLTEVERLARRLAGVLAAMEQNPTVATNISLLEAIRGEAEGLWSAVPRLLRSAEGASRRDSPVDPEEVIRGITEVAPIIGAAGAAPMIRTEDESALGGPEGGTAGTETTGEQR